MPWIGKKLYNKIPRKTMLKEMNINQLAKLCSEYHILVTPTDDKADIIKSILFVEKELDNV